MREMKTLLNTISFILIVLTAVALAAEELPEGWRFATKDELKTPPINWREESPSKFTKAEADFNGDGKTDIAYLAKSTEYSGQGLLVRLSSKNKYEWLVLDEIKWGAEYPNVDLSMGIEIAEPQNMKTACGKGYWECSGIEKPEITLKNPGINYYKFASASSVFYWDSTRMKFIRIWTSD